MRPSRSGETTPLCTAWVLVRLRRHTAAGRAEALQTGPLGIKICAGIASL